MNRPRIRTLQTLFLALVISFAALFVVLARGAVQNPTAQGKKKPPPGASGFEQFAGRDAADKLIKGAATRRRPPAGIIKPIPKLLLPPHELLARDAEQQRAAGNFEAAVASYREAIKEGSVVSPAARAELQYALGKVYREMERYEDAVAEFQAAANIPPASEIALYANYELGNAYLDVGKYAEAVAAYEKTLELLHGEWAKVHPSQSAQYLPYPHYSKGLAHLGLKQNERAAADFARALELKPDFAEAHFNLGLVLWRMGRKTEAQERQKKLSEVNAELAARLAAHFK